MNCVNVNQFQENIKHFIKQVINQHIPLKVKGNDGEDFVIISAEDWQQQQETLYVLQNSSLMQQIADSSITHKQRKGYSPTDEELDEIIDI
ncbi:MAG: type II toxin-antitoxin system Phd/YefM family antitoxin [Crocosphaera sp.]